MRLLVSVQKRLHQCIERTPIDERTKQNGHAIRSNFQLAGRKNLVLCFSSSMAERWNVYLFFSSEIIPNGDISNKTVITLPSNTELFYFAITASSRPRRLAFHITLRIYIPDVTTLAYRTKRIKINDHYDYVSCIKMQNIRFTLDM